MGTVILDRGVAGGVGLYILMSRARYEYGGRMAIIISNKIRGKLKEKHGVREEEVEECFANLVGDFLRDQREDHRSDPPTLWFIAETYMGRKLKVAFIPVDGDFHVRTAYEPNDEEVRIYRKYGENQ